MTTTNDALTRADRLAKLGRHEGAKRLRDTVAAENLERRTIEIAALNAVVQALTDAKSKAKRTSDKYFDGMLIAAVDFDTKFHTKIEKE